MIVPKMYQDLISCNFDHSGLFRLHEIRPVVNVIALKQTDDTHRLIKDQIKCIHEPFHCAVLFGFWEIQRPDIGDWSKLRKKHPCIAAVVYLQSFWVHEHVFRYYSRKTACLSHGSKWRNSSKSVSPDSMRLTRRRRSAKHSFSIREKNSSAFGLCFCM
jgi:hypothetical protein